MAFVGQLYSSDWFLLADLLALQFFVCDDCRVSFNGANDRVPIHMEQLPLTALANASRVGVRSKRQPIRYISYTPIVDSIDQWTLHRRELAEEELPDEHLRRDKVGGLFPYDGYDSPKITRRNRMIAQFAWEGIGGPVYLYQSTSKGIYLFHYR
jgi:hypothetical protein